MPEPKKILIVEDELPLLELLTSELTRQGYIVMQARNGVDGYKMAIEGQPDLVLLDIVMPVLDGMSTLKKLRESEVGKYIPVIMLTNLNDADQVSDALSLNAGKFIVKSDWKMEDVIKKIKESLGEGKK